MAWFSRLRNLFRSDRLSDEIQREMDFHIAERVDDLVARGVRSDIAQRDARRRFGNYGRQKEHTRERNLIVAMDTFIADLRYALRALKAAPAFTLVAVLSLGLGIGANTAIFTLLDAVLLKSLPVRHPEELLAIKFNKDNATLTNPLWEAIRDRQDVFTQIAAYSARSFNLSDKGEVRNESASWVSGNYFAMLGVQPVVGRMIVDADDRRGCPPIAVVSEQFWRDKLGARADVVGSTISVETHPFTIVGVSDGRFFGVEVGKRVSIFAPICAEPVVRGSTVRLFERSTWWLNILARPKPGLTLEQVNARLATLAPGITAATMPRDWPATATERYRKAGLSVEPAAGGLSRLRTQYKLALRVLMAVVGVVLLIACANVANLLLARAAAREREMAVRLAIGAGRGRLVRQLLTESLLLSSLGALLGAVFATWGTRILVSMLSTTDDAVTIDLSVDVRMLGFTIAVAVASGLLFGLVPAWRAGRVDPHAAMKAHARGFAGGPARLRMGKALVVTQVALSLVLVGGAGLLLGSWSRLAHINPGFRSDGVLMANVSTRNANVADSARTGVYRDVLQRLRGMPAVVAASASDITPISNSTWNDVIKVDGFAAKSEDDALVWFNEISDGYFTTLGTTLVAGRDFSGIDVPTSPKVAIVTESMARHFFPGSVQGAIGRQFSIQHGSSYDPPVRIVGVVKDMKYESLRDSLPPIAFLSQSQNASLRNSMIFSMRIQGDASSAIPSVRSTLLQINPSFTLQFTTLERQIDDSLTLPRTLAALSGFFGGLALLLATIGLYGIMAYGVARRRNEIGVRIALGAGRSRVVRMVLGEVGRLVVAGVVIGVAFALAATRIVTSFLYGVAPNDPMTLALAATALIAVGLAAALLPAMRAARLDPVEALRED
jgi:putative ABC transport system permease protein